MFSMKAEKERMAEIEKVKKRREERAIEKAQHEEEVALLARERARAEFQDWEKEEEDQFHFDQSKARSEIRLREGRIKPIDILSKHHLIYPPDDEPQVVFKGLTVKETEEDLHEDIKMHLDLDRATPTRAVYIGREALPVVCDWELAESRKKDALDRARVRGEQPPAVELLIAEERERGLHSSIETDVKNLLQEKTFAELQMRAGTAKVVEYWEAVIKRLHIYKAKACLKEIHAKILLREQPLGSEDNMESLITIEEEEEFNHDEEEDVEPVSPAEPIPVEEPTDDGSYSPELLHGDDRNDDAVDPEEDRAIVKKERIAVLKEKQAEANSGSNG